MEKRYSGRKHELLYLLWGKLKGAQKNWHIQNKEKCPILSALRRFDWLFHGHPREIDYGRSRAINFFGDHLNLKAILDPTGKQVENKATLSRLYRGEVWRSEFLYRIRHVPGQHNVFADLLTRWGITHVEFSMAKQGFVTVKIMLRSVKENHGFRERPSSTTAASRLLLS